MSERREYKEHDYKPIPQQDIVIWTEPGWTECVMTLAGYNQEGKAVWVIQKKEEMEIIWNPITEVGILEVDVRGKYYIQGRGIILDLEPGKPQKNIKRGSLVRAVPHGGLYRVSDIERAMRGDHVVDTALVVTEVKFKGS